MGSPDENGPEATPNYDDVIYDQEFVLEDVLPSFEMHNYLFNRTVFDQIENSSRQSPPNYEDNFAHNGNGPSLSHHDIDPLANPELLILNNLEKMQLINIPVRVSLSITKRFPHYGVNPERENPLRVYKPGDVVTGYAMIENVSSKPIPFEMFLVSLEGTATVPTSQSSTDSKRLNRNNFLKMYDLSACFNYGCLERVEAEVGPNLGPGIDPTDGSYKNFPSKMLKPGEKYKKRFLFRLPEAMLDTACEHQSYQHLRLPPSFGVDPQSCGGNAKYIQVDEVLGYGRGQGLGEPIVTKDLHEPGQSISYSVNVKLLGTRQDQYKEYYHESVTHDYDMIVLKDSCHFIRFSPPLVKKENVEYDFSSQVPTSVQIANIEHSVTNTLLELEEKQNLKKCGVTDPAEIGRLLAEPGSSLAKKREQLMLSDRDQKSPFEDSSKVARATKSQLTKSLFSNLHGQVDFKVGYDKGKRVEPIVPGALLKMSFSDTPSRYRSALEETQKPKKGSSIFDSIGSFSTTRTSHQSSQSNGKGDLTKTLNTLDAQVRFRSSSKPPVSIIFKTKLKVMNIYSQYPLPITFDEEFFADVKSNSDITRAICKKFGTYIDSMKQLAAETDEKVPLRLYHDMLALNQLKYTEKVVDIFSESKQSVHWRVVETLGKGEKIYEANVSIPLEVNQKRAGCYHILPTFQSCTLSRKYSLQASCHIKTEKVSVELPVEIG